MQWMIHGAKNDEEEEWFLCFGASLGPVFPIYVPTSQISFNWLPRRREWLCCFFLLCVSESTSHHLQLRKKPVWFNSDAANLIFYFDWILWKIALENLMRFSNIFQFSWSAIAFFFSLAMRDLWMLTIASCPHLDFVTMFGFLLFCDCLVWLMAIGPSNGNCK